MSALRLSRIPRTRDSWFFRDTICKIWVYIAAHKNHCYTSNKWSKNFDERPHRRGHYFSLGKYNDVTVLDCFCGRPIGSMRGNPEVRTIGNGARRRGGKSRRHSPQNYPFTRGNWTPSNSYFLGPTRVSIQNGITIGSTALQGSRS